MLSTLSQHRLDGKHEGSTASTNFNCWFLGRSVVRRKNMAQLSQIVAQSLNYPTLSAARRAIAEAVARDPHDKRSVALLAILATLPVGEVIPVGGATTVQRISGPRGQSTTHSQTAECWKLAAAYASSNAPVLILGESGTGKEAIAKILHDSSERKEEPFIPINCGGFTESLVESELFGYERGAFTGANATRRGALESAKGGTVFLDEVGELPLSVQVRLLRLLEDRTFRRVGGDGAAPLSFRARIVAATHRDLRAMVAAGQFREDLYYRLAVLVLKTVPLRDRVDDVIALAEDWLAADGLCLSPAARDKLAQYSWPGNVRELNNVVRRGAIHASIRNSTEVLVPDLGLD